MNLQQWLRASVLVLATAVPALASAVVVTFSGQGITSLTGNGGPNNGLELSVTDAPYVFTFPGNVVESGWLLDSTFVVEGLAVGQPGASKGQATYSNGGGDSLVLDFEGLPVGGGPGFVVMHLDYQIVGGSGRFMQAAGSGFEDVTITLAPGRDFAFSGVGQLQIPEPETLTLALAGLPGLLAAMGRRRKPRGLPATLPPAP